MTESAERLFVEWLREGPERGSAEGLQRALAATRETPQRPGWTIPERWLPMQLTMQPSILPRLSFLVLAGAVLAAALAGALLLVGSQRQPAPPFGLAANGSIVMGVDTVLWLANPDGSGARPLDIGLGLATSPAYSPDGTEFAFKTHPAPRTPWAIYVAAADGSNARSVTGDFPIAASELDGITWAPDGSAIIFASSDQGITRLYRVDVAGGAAPHALTDTRADRANPAWSPDGSLLTYQAKPSGGGVSTALMVSRPDGTDERSLVAVDHANASFAAPQWAADSLRIAYFRSDGGPHVVAFVDLQGRETVVSLPSEDAFNPSWSPDGTRLAYSTRDGGVVVDVANPSTRIAIPKRFSDCGLTWSPDAGSLLGIDVACTGVYRIPLEDPGAAIRIAVPPGPVDIITWQRTAP